MAALPLHVNFHMLPSVSLHQQTNIDINLFIYFNLHIKSLALHSKLKSMGICWCLKIIAAYSKN